MSSSRPRILASIRQSLIAAHLPATPSINCQLPIISPQSPVSSLQSLFATELRALSGLCLTPPIAKAPALIAGLLRERQATGALCWAQAQLPVPGLWAALQAEGFVLDDGALPVGDHRSERLREIERLTVGITGADAALAETGTLALRTGAGRPRLASLSVRTHIALITPTQFYPSWAAWWAAHQHLPEWIQEASNLTLISGPSRTADIEMTLTVGVHGPREVIAVVVGDGIAINREGNAFAHGEG
jgi:L-lactate dehydrogenase complex protein LldG